ncbi:MAG: glycerate kinase [Tannerellaceae bacterium]|jgi:glycerate kinase|nr:glycerate kinase [Tannerellaceae bacterium]
MRKVIIAIDSFKGCLTSIEAGQAAKEGVACVFPDCEIFLLPVADGGEGILDALLSTMKGKYIQVTAHDPLMNPVQAIYGISGGAKTALIEMASVSGLPLVPANKRNPMLTTSFGTGELIKDALKRGCRDFIIGIGGSATNDAGLGMLQALGFRFLDKNGNALGVGGKILIEVASIDTSSAYPALKEAWFIVACDVHNPFYGPNGAAHIYARQKGADDNMIEELDAGMRSLANIIRQTTGKDIATYPGTGAAGGMGGGCLAFLNATLKPGIKLLLDTLCFEEKIRNADLIITGEGRADRQTAMGKLPFGILKEAEKQHIPVVVIAGSIEDVTWLNEAGFRSVFTITPGPVSPEKAMEPGFAKANIKRLVSQLCYIIYTFKST